MKGLFLRTGLALALAVTLVLPSGIVPGEAGVNELRFTILHTGDEHSALIPHSPAVDYDPRGDDGTVGGFARLAGLVKSVRSTLDAPALLVSSGDFLGGTMFSWLALEGQAPELTLMAEIGYDVIAIGNHEFDYGPGVLAGYLEAAGYPRADGPVLLGGNMEIPDGHPLVGAGIRRSTTIRLPNGLVVGLFSLMGEDAARVAPLADPVTFSDQHEAAQQLVASLRAAGAHVVVAVTHSGVDEDLELARQVDGIDVIVGGHCHTPLNAPLVENGTIIVQAGPHAEYLGVLDLAYNPETRLVRVRNAETGRPFLNPVDGRAPADPVIEELVSEYSARVSATLSRLTGGAYADILQPVVVSQFPVERRHAAESALGNLVTDAMKWAAAEAGHAVDFAFQANGQIRADLVPGRSPGREGMLSAYDVVMAASLGFGPGDSPGVPLTVVYLTGDEIRRVLEISVLLSQALGDSYYLQVSGLSFTYDPGRAILFWLPVLGLPVPSYRAVTSVNTVDGREIRWGDEELYGVAADLYVGGMVPMVGDMLPRLAITPRDESGHPITDLEGRIIYRNGRQVPVWGALLSYLGAMDRGPGDLPVMAPQYVVAEGRARRVKTFPLAVWLVLGAILVAAGTVWVIVLGIRWLVRRKRSPGRRRDRAPGG